MGTEGASSENKQGGCNHVATALLESHCFDSDYRTNITLRLPSGFPSTMS